MQVVSLNLSKAQLKKLSSGKPVELKGGAMIGSTKLILHPENIKKVNSALKKKKGTRIKLSNEEIMHNVQGGFLGPILASALIPAIAPAIGTLAQNLVGRI